MKKTTYALIAMVILLFVSNAAIVLYFAYASPSGDPSACYRSPIDTEASGHNIFADVNNIVIIDSSHSDISSMTIQIDGNDENCVDIDYIPRTLNLKTQFIGNTLTIVVLAYHGGTLHIKSSPLKSLTVKAHCIVQLNNLFVDDVNLKDVHYVGYGLFHPKSML